MFIRKRYEVTMFVTRDELAFAVQLFDHYEGGWFGHNDLTVNASDNGKYVLKFHVWGEQNLTDVITKYTSVRCISKCIWGLEIR